MAERFQVELGARAAKELRKLDRSVQARIVAALVLLGEYPRPPAATSLAGHPEYLRVGVGDWRVVYKVDRTRLVVLVLTIGHHGSVYRSLP